MKYDAKIVGQRIITERKRLELTQTELGEIVGVAMKQIWSYEHGRLLPPLKVLLKLCEFFNCSFAYILGEQNYRRSNIKEGEIMDYTGLDLASIQSICRITGSRNGPVSSFFNTQLYKNGYQTSISLRKTLNNMLSSNKLIPFIGSLTELEDYTQQYNDIWNDINNSIGKQRFDEAMDLFRSNEDYFSHPTDFSEQLINDVILISEVMDKARSLELTIKANRYALFEAYIQLIDSLIPNPLAE